MRKKDILGMSGTAMGIKQTQYVLKMLLLLFVKGDVVNCEINDRM